MYKTKDNWVFFDRLQKSISKRGQKLKFNEEDDPNTQIGRFIPHHHRLCKWGKPATVPSTWAGMFTSAKQSWWPVWTHLLSWPPGLCGLQKILAFKVISKMPQWEREWDGLMESVTKAGNSTRAKWMGSLLAIRVRSCSAGPAWWQSHAGVCVTKVLQHPRDTQAKDSQNWTEKAIRVWGWVCASWHRRARNVPRACCVSFHRIYVFTFFKRLSKLPA